MRLAPTPSEFALQSLLMDVSVLFQPQWPFVRGSYCYIADFRIELADRAYLVVEVDGPSHDTTRAYDARRDERMKRSCRCIAVLRFSNQDVACHPGAVLDTILCFDPLRVSAAELSAWMRGRAS